VSRRHSSLGRLLVLALAAAALPAGAQEARRRWEQQCQMRRDKFDLVLPEAMRENAIDMWIVQLKEGHREPLYEALGRGYATGIGYYVFTDRGDGRIERALLGVEGYLVERCGVYDVVGEAADLPRFVAERAPRRIGVDMAEEIGMADGLSHVGYQQLVAALGEPWSGRLVSAERLVSDFLSRRVASEVFAFGEAAELSKSIAERALSNAVITPGVTTLEDVAWWMQDQLLAQGLEAAFDMPSVYIIGPKGIEEVSTPRIIQRGDLLVIDWGVCRLDLCTDMKRMAYVLKPSETRPPAGIQNAYDVALKVREIIRHTIMPGRTAAETHDRIDAALEQAGYAIMKEFNKPTAVPKTEVIVVSHAVANRGHGEGPSIAFFTPRRAGYELKPTNLLSIEFFAWTPAAEWGGAKVRIPLEDDAIVTPRGIEWLAAPAQRILLVK